MGVSIIIPVHNPDKEILKKILVELKNQSYKGKSEIIQINIGKGLAESMNTGFRKAKNEIVVSLHQDCIPQGKFWLENLVKPFKEKRIIATVSKVELPISLWESFDKIAQALTLKELGVIQPLLDEKGCAYKRSVLKEVGFFDEKNFRTAGEDFDLYIKLKNKGIIAYPEATVIHLHKTTGFSRLNKERQYANGFGTLVRIYGTKMPGWHKGLIKAIPLIGIIPLLVSFPYKKAKELSFY
ncbi:MAG: glycosyltransferase family 2 protein, partial [Candidatus Staskawiczbacteria bacterium]|nr:glycosyltransferase family 2 protein [Candidatus Staskawiczbacteria bacterium]